MTTDNTTTEPAMTREQARAALLAVAEKAMALEVGLSDAQANAMDRDPEFRAALAATRNGVTTEKLNTLEKALCRAYSRIIGTYTAGLASVASGQPAPEGTS